MASGLTQLHQFIVAHHSLDELRTLCFELDVNYDDLGGEALTGKARELILRLHRERALDKLLPILATTRPEAFAGLGLNTGSATLDALYAESPAHSLPDKSQRDLELAYLDDLLKRYEYWRDHYTPLAGIAEVRAAVKDGPRLDLPMPFVPREFEVLGEHGYGPRTEVRREKVEDLREAIAQHRCIILLGDPGSGKTTTLWRLAYDYAEAAREDSQQPLPVFVPLGGYSHDGSFETYLARHLGPLAPYLDTYRASGRLILLLDGLNEMPRAGYKERVGRIQDVLDQHSNGAVVVTCRELDYVIKLEKLHGVEVSPLDPLRIRTFLHHYLGEKSGEGLLREIAGGATLDYQLRDLLEDRSSLLALCRNPYILLMTAQIYAGSSGGLPSNRAHLFAAFVDTLLRREKERQAERWIPIHQLNKGLMGLAYAMQEAGERGTSVDRRWVLEQLCAIVPDCDIGQLLYLVTSATLLDADDTTICFHHQLLQEYFAARELGKRVDAGEPLSLFWPIGEWWEPSGWEETFILLSGLREDASELVARLADVHAVVAARCLLEGGAKADERTRQSLIDALVPLITNEKLPAIARVQAGAALGGLGDPRPGVGLRPDGLPDIAWCEVPEGPFLMGQDNDRVELATFWIARYPITNAQYAAFVQDGGYTECWRHCWTEDGWQWKRDMTEPQTFGGVYDLPNHPVVGITGFEAMAFGRWLTEQLRAADALGVDQEVTLPDEAQWEKAARGMDGRTYPWGNEADSSRTNARETGIGTTSAVGCFPGGASPYGVLEMSGNVWEWTLSKGYHSRYTLRGGAFTWEIADCRCVARGGSYGNYSNYCDSFRLIAPISLP